MTQKQLLTKLYQSFLRDHKPSGMISVSKLAQDCLRKSYYDHLHGPAMDARTITRLWLGTAMHEHSFLKDAEMEVKWQGIIGRVDEYEEKSGVLVEKKTTKRITNYPPSESYIRQVEYYNVLLTKNNYPVKASWLLYIQLEPADLKFVEVTEQIRPLDRIEKEMLNKYTMLTEAIKVDKPPERETGWLCKYCTSFNKCYAKKTKTN